MEKIKLNTLTWIRGNQKEFWILVAIIAIAAFCRLYKIDQYMTFLGDEARDVIVVRRLLVEHHPPLIGPGTSTGNMYLGPLYYYMMAPALLIANFSPVGPAVQIALLGVLTVLFVWYVGRIWFGKVPGIIAAALFAISPTVIIFSRSSWNPNIMPFFALLSIYSIWKVWRQKLFNWLIVLGVSYAFVLQSHYLGLLLSPVLFLYWLLTPIKLKKNSLEKQKFVTKSLYGIGIFGLLMSPLLIFDIRHGWINTKAIISFFAERQALGTSFSLYLTSVGNNALMISSNLISGKNTWVAISILAIFLTTIIWLYKNKKLNSPYGLIFLWLVVGIFGLSIYKGSVYDHYLEFLFPVPFLLIGGVWQVVVDSKNILLKILYILTIGVLLILNIKNNPLFSDPNTQLQRSISVARVIQEKAGDAPFNLATISNNSNKDVYQYFLMVWGTKIIDLDPSNLGGTLTPQLFVVCEFPREKCDPIHDPAVWITSFGWNKISEEWPVWGGTLFKLVQVSMK